MSNQTSKNTTVGVFETRAAAEHCVAELKSSGYRDDQISMVGKNADGKTVKTDGTLGSNAGEGLAIGAAAGGGALALGSLAMSLGIIPVIGPILAVGPLAAALITGIAGAAAGGLAGTLIGWGIPEQDAKYYEGEVGAGRFIVTVDGGDKPKDTWGVFSKHGGYDRTRSSNASGN